MSQETSTLICSDFRFTSKIPTFFQNVWSLLNNIAKLQQSSFWEKQIDDNFNFKLEITQAWYLLCLSQNLVLCSCWNTGTMRTILRKKAFQPGLTRRKRVKNTRKNFWSWLNLFCNGLRMQMRKTLMTNQTHKRISRLEPMELFLIVQSISTSIPK